MGTPVASESPRPNGAGALFGRRIVVTRAPEQAGELLQRLEGLGAEVLFLPMVRFLDPEDAGELDRAIDSLDGFDWLIFSSANAARFFLKRCRALGRWPSAERPRIASVGTATCAAVAAERLSVALVPQEFSGAGLAAALAGGIAGKKILLPRSDRASDELPGLLRSAGANVVEVIAYRTAEPEALDPEARATLLRGEADAITFFSPSAFEHFSRAMGSEGLREMGLHAAFAAVGPVTGAAIRKAGLTVAVQADEASAASLAVGLERYFASRAAAKERT
jgi:uroporphyrinogen III methyltransferase / synthase